MENHKEIQETKANQFNINETYDKAKGIITDNPRGKITEILAEYIIWLQQEPIYTNIDIATCVLELHNLAQALVKNVCDL